MDLALVLLAHLIAPPAQPAAQQPSQPATVPTAPRPATYTLDWSAPERCPDGASIDAKIAALLQGTPDGQGDMKVAARVTHEGGLFTLAVTTEFMGQLERREPVRARKCGDLSDTVALVVAIALQPQVDRGQNAPALAGANPGPAPIPEPIAQPIPHPIREPTDSAPRRPAPDEGPGTPAPLGVDAPAPSDRADVRPPSAPLPDRGAANFGVSLRLAPAMHLGALPRVGGGFVAAVGLSWTRLRLEVFGVYLWPQRNRSNSGLFQLGAAGARACGRLMAGRIEFPVCGAAEAGALRVDSRGLTPSNTIQSPWFAGLLGAGLATRGRRVGFWSLVEAAVPIVRPRFLVGSATAFEGSPVTLRVAAGLEVFFR